MDRAVTPVVAAVLLVAITVVGAAGVGSVASGLEDRPDTAGAATIAVSATAETQSITLAHRGGATVDFRNASVRIRVDGVPLDYQPPVPYFATEGFQGTPTGPFNAGADPRFDPGEAATLQLASTNAPHFDAGDRVAVSIHRDGRVLARGEVVAG